MVYEPCWIAVTLSLVTSDGLLCGSFFRRFTFGGGLLSDTLETASRGKENRQKGITKSSQRNKFPKETDSKKKFPKTTKNTVAALN